MIPLREPRFPYDPSFVLFPYDPSKGTKVQGATQRVGAKKWSTFGALPL